MNDEIIHIGVFQDRRNWHSVIFHTDSIEIFADRLKLGHDNYKLLKYVEIHKDSLKDALHQLEREYDTNQIQSG